MVTDPRAAIPGVDRLLERTQEDPRFQDHPPGRRTVALRMAVEAARPRVASGAWPYDPAEPAPYLDAAADWLDAEARPSLIPVINATGVILHTNLGRAPLASDAWAAMEAVTAGYSNLEFDLETGRRGSRYQHCAELITELTAAEDGLVVNNCAGGLVLALAALARSRDVVVSRGEMVEIGGGFRIPEVLEQAGAGLREVGATNRTRVRDYEAALRSGGVAAILKVHRSNFRISGFTEEATLQELSELGRRYGVPVVYDLGSGLLLDASLLGLPAEPTPAESVRHGADLVVFSGDKLLGGPQAGLVAGRRDLIARLKTSPLCRALRVDKGTLAALEATLRLYRNEALALARIPALRMLAAPVEELEDRARALVLTLEPTVTVTVERGAGRVGGGTYPEHPVPSVLLRLPPGVAGAEALARRLRSGEPPVIGRVEDETVLLDLRSVLPEQDSVLGSRIHQAVSAPEG